MAAQVQLAISADARASIVCGIFAAAASGTLVLLFTSTTLHASSAAVAAAWTTFVTFMVAAAFCAWAIWPCDFHLPGNEPSNWYEDIERDVTLRKAVGEQLELFDEDIRENNETLAKNAKRFQIGIIIGMFAPLFGAIAAHVPK